MSDPLLIIIAAPSGGGKSTVLRRVFAEVPALQFSISHTTRAPRAGEQNGREYFFVDENTFRASIAEGAFLEWAEVHGNMYGTSVEEVERQQQAGLDVVLDIDVQGAGQVRDQTAPVTIFIAPPSLEELERRLRGRGSEAEAAVALRLANAREELVCADTYEYLIINDRLEDAVESLKGIIIAERSRHRRNPDGQPMRWRC